MNTVKVRVCVLVGSDGDYIASGEANITDEAMVEGIKYLIDSQSTKLYWMEAELPLPKEVVVIPSVTCAEDKAEEYINTEQAH